MSGRPWTETEKMGVLLQIVKLHSVQWSKVELPPGRTLKAVEMMIERESRRCGIGKVHERQQSSRPLTAAPTGQNAAGEKRGRGQSFASSKSDDGSDEVDESEDDGPVGRENAVTTKPDTPGKLRSVVKRPREEDLFEFPGVNENAGSPSAKLGGLNPPAAVLRARYHCDEPVEVKETIFHQGLWRDA